MQEEQPFTSLEERLHEEAQRLIADCPSLHSIARMQTTFTRRRRRGTVGYVVGTSAALAVAGFIIAGRLRQPLAEVHERANAAQHTPRQGPVVKAPAPSVKNHSNDPAVPNGIERPRVVAIGFSIIGPGNGNQPEYVRGWYVPEQADPIDPQSLSAAERAAVSSLLGSDSELFEDEKI